MTGDLERLMAIEPSLVVAGADDGIRVIGLGLAGRRDQARLALEAMRRTTRIATFNSWAEYLMAWLDKRAADMWSNNMAALGGLKIRDDPEAIFQEGWLLCDVGAHQQGLPYLRRAVEKGYFARRHPRPQPALRRAARRSRLPGGPGPGGRRPRARAGGVPRGRGRAAPRPMMRPAP